MENALFIKKPRKEGQIAPSCIVCQNKTCLKTKKPCKEIEKLLCRPQGGISGRRLKFYDPKILEKIADEIEARGYTTKGGKKKKAHIYGDNWQD